jgi:DNA-binding NtrC family response regulator
MSARVVIVHDDRGFLDPLASALRRAGHSVAGFSDPMAALTALDAPEKIALLITGVQFPPGKPNGVALACMARSKRRKIQVIFTARAEFAEYSEGLGTFIAVPVDLAEVVATVGRLLRAADELRDLTLARDGVAGTALTA